MWELFKRRADLWAMYSHLEGHKVTTKLHELAIVCWNGACNPAGIIRGLAECIGEVPAGQYRQSVDLKIIVGQLSFLLGESLGPSVEVGEAFTKLLLDDAEGLDVPLSLLLG